MLRREGTGTSRITPTATPTHTSPPSPIWSPDFAQLPAPSEQPEAIYSDEAPMSQQAIAPGKTSSDSGQQPGTDRWSQRRLQRLHTEQGFREQRQGGQTVLSPQASASEQGGYNSLGAQYPAQQTQPQQSLHQQPQPHPTQQATYQSSRTAQHDHSNAGLASQTQPVSNSSRSPNYQHPEQFQQSQQYSSPDSGPQYQDTSRPGVTQSRSYSLPHSGADDTSMSANNGGLPAPKPLRSGASNRQSVHNGLSAGAREGSSTNSAQQQTVPAFNASVVPPGGQGQARSQQQGDVGRVTPQPAQAGEDMSEEDINQLIKDHKELRK